jgi:hypothetical protein
MRKLTLTLIGLAFSGIANAQDFNTNIQTARQSYGSGSLEASRFAMQQALQEIDIISGKEALKILPSTLGGLNAKLTEDKVSGAAGFAGAVIHREYEAAEKRITVEIISNSPLISSINAILALPFIGAGSNGDQKMVKIDGYKALIQKSSDSSVPGYEIQVPMGSALITVRTENYADDIMNVANNIPVSLIARQLN